MEILWTPQIYKNPLITPFISLHTYIDKNQILKIWNELRYEQSLTWISQVSYTLHTVIVARLTIFFKNKIEIEIEIEIEHSPSSIKNLLLILID